MSWIIGLLTGRGTPTSSSSSSNGSPQPAINHPPITSMITPEDVLGVKRCLSVKGLPLEIIDIIIDAAEYWPCLRSIVASYWDLSASDGPQNNATVLYLRTPPVPGTFPFLPPPPDYTVTPYGNTDDGDVVVGPSPYVRGLNPVRKVVFRFRSRDQGWVDDASIRMTYQGAYSWFEVAPESPVCTDALVHATALPRPVSMPQGPDGCERGWMRWEKRWNVQRNASGDPEARLREVVWTSEDEAEEEGTEGWTDEHGKGRGGNLVRALKVGDRLCIMARAQYPGWRNIVSGAEVVIYYAV